MSERISAAPGSMKESVMPALDGGTQVCISIAESPGRIGMALHNAGYRTLGLNFLYKAFAVTDLAGAIAGVRALGIRGVSVSMPFKEAVIGYLEACDPAARAVGAVNTVVNHMGRLVGYNTDVQGAASALGELGPWRGRSVLILGAGGAARAITAAVLAGEPASLRIAARTPQRAAAVARVAGADVIGWEERYAVRADLVINATPVGMSPQTDASPFDLDRSTPAVVMDAVIAPLETRLMREALERGLRVVPGYRMALFQAAAQFELYTGHPAPMDVFEQTLRTLQEPPA